MLSPLEIKSLMVSLKVSSMLHKIRIVSVVRGKSGESTFNSMTSWISLVSCKFWGTLFLFFNDYMKLRLIAEAFYVIFMCNVL